MRLSRAIFGSFVACAGMLLALYLVVSIKPAIKRLKYTYTYSIEVTVNADTPTGHVSASSVWSAKLYDEREESDVTKYGILHGPPFWEQNMAEAIPIEVTPHTWIIVHGTLWHIVQDNLFSDGTRKTSRTRVPHIKSLIGQPPIQISTDSLQGVVFLDNRDPTTARDIDLSNIAETLGPGYAITSITIAATDQPFTVGQLDAVLPWWETSPYVNRAGELILPGEPSAVLSHSDLWKGGIRRWSFKEPPTAQQP